MLRNEFWSWSERRLLEVGTLPKCFSGYSFKYHTVDGSIFFLTILKMLHMLTYLTKEIWPRKENGLNRQDIHVEWKGRPVSRNKIKFYGTNFLSILSANCGLSLYDHYWIPVFIDFIIFHLDAFFLNSRALEWIIILPKNFFTLIN